MICGNIGVSQALDLVEKHFGRIPGHPPAARAVAGNQPHSGTSTTVHRAVPHPLGYLSWLAPPVHAPEWLPLELALAILADGHSSRLHRELVRTRGIAREVHATALGHLHDSSLACILARPAEGTDTVVLLEKVREVVEDLATTGPTRDELGRAVAQYERDWLTGLSTVESRADAIQEAWLTFASPQAINERVAEFEAVSPDDVRRAATQLAQTTASELHYLPEES